MVCKKIKLLGLVISLIFSSPGLSQEGGGDEYFEDGFRDISRIGATAVGGTILGLSTLSFVDEPGDHLKNIYVGTAIGVIIGVGLVAYMAATKNKGLYEDNASLKSPPPGKLFATGQRKLWHQKIHSAHNKQQSEPSLLGYQFRF